MFQYAKAHLLVEKAIAICKRHRLPWPMDEKQLWKETDERVCPGDVTEEEFWLLFQVCAPEVAFFQEPPLGAPAATENQAARVDLLAQRYHNGQSLWHPEDRIDGMLPGDASDGVCREGGDNRPNGRGLDRYPIRCERPGALAVA